MASANAMDMDLTFLTDYNAVWDNPDKSDESKIRFNAEDLIAAVQLHNLWNDAWRQEFANDDTDLDADVTISELSEWNSEPASINSTEPVLIPTPVSEPTTVSESTTVCEPTTEMESPPPKKKAAPRKTQSKKKAPSKAKAQDAIKKPSRAKGQNSTKKQSETKTKPKTTKAKAAKSGRIEKKSPVCTKIILRLKPESECSSASGSRRGTTSE